MDSPGDYLFDCRPGTHHPHSGAHDRDDQQAQPHLPADDPGDGREPTPEELGERMEMPEDKVRRVLKIAKEPISMETPIGDDEDSHLGDFIEDVTIGSPVELATGEGLKEATREVLGGLTAREAKVLRMRFGIDMNTDHTLEEVGKQFDVTRERIRQIEKYTAGPAGVELLEFRAGLGPPRGGGSTLAVTEALANFRDQGAPAREDVPPLGYAIAQLHGIYIYLNVQSE